MRQLTDDDLVARSYAVTHPGGSIVMPGPPGWHQLLHASSGVLRVETGASVWVVPPHRALWLPDGSQARVVMAGRVAIRTLYVRGPGLLPDRIVAVDVPPLLRELILHAVRLCPLERARPQHRRIVDMIGDQLATAPESAVTLPTPRDPRAVALARALADDPAGAVPLSLLVRGTGAGRRTQERLFAAETGLTIAQWRQRMRLARALELLGAGTPVTDVAVAVGYATPSAFTAMFRAQLGEPPGRYLSRGRRGASAAGPPR